jgi:hypothetical protein
VKVMHYFSLLYCTSLYFWTRPGEAVVAVTKRGRHNRICPKGEKIELRFQVFLTVPDFECGMKNLPVKSGLPLPALYCQ